MLATGAEPPPPVAKNPVGLAVTLVLARFGIVKHGVAPVPHGPAALPASTVVVYVPELVPYETFQPTTEGSELASHARLT